MNLKKAYNFYKKININTNTNFYKINSSLKNKKCEICKNIFKCGLCQRFGDIEGQKWYSQSKNYLSE